MFHWRPKQNDDGSTDDVVGGCNPIPSERASLGIGKVLRGLRHEKKAGFHPDPNSNLAARPWIVNEALYSPIATSRHLSTDSLHFRRKNSYEPKQKSNNATLDHPATSEMTRVKILGCWAIERVLLRRWRSAGRQKDEYSFILVSFFVVDQIFPFSWPIGINKRISAAGRIETPFSKNASPVSRKTTAIDVKKRAFEKWRGVGGGDSTLLRMPRDGKRVVFRFGNFPFFIFALLNLALERESFSPICTHAKKIRTFVVYDLF